MTHFEYDTEAPNVDVKQARRAVVWAIAFGDQPGESGAGQKNRHLRVVNLTNVDASAAGENMDALRGES